VERHADVLRFWQLMIQFRRNHPTVHRSRFFTGRVNDRGLPDIAWHGCRLGQPVWDDPEGRAFAFTLAGFGGESDIHVMMNMYWGNLDFDVPEASGWHWYRVIDTAAKAPNDIADPGQEVTIGNTRTMNVRGRSVVLLISKPA
jgi:isoamylase